MRLVMTNRAERVAEDPLELRDAHDPTGVITDRCQVPNLSECDEPLVPRVVVGNRMEEVHVRQARQPAMVEVRKTPELEAFAHHRVEISVLGLLDVAIRRLRPEREVEYAAQRLTGIRA